MQSIMAGSMNNRKESSSVLAYLAAPLGPDCSLTISTAPTLCRGISGFSKTQFPPLFLLGGTWALLCDTLA